MSAKTPSGRRLRVLESLVEPRPTTNPYLVQLTEALNSVDELDIAYFTYRRAILGRYDVLHIHWPELLMGGHRPIGRAVRRSLSALLVLRLRLTRVAVVRTWHNVEPPSGLARIDYAILRALENRTTLRINLNSVEPPSEVPSVVILHGDYRQWFEPFPQADPQIGHIAYVGLVRRYKGIESLVEAFASTSDPGLTLAVSGKPSTTDIAVSIARLADADARITFAPDFLSESELVRAITLSEVVVLPYRNMHNSGTVLACLSLARCVLVPDTVVNRSLQVEVGSDWVRLFTGTISPADVEDAVAAVRGRRPDSQPDLSARGWQSVGTHHFEAFRRAVELVRKTR